MSDALVTVLIIAACALFGVAVWDAAVASANTQHCREQMGGVPVKTPRGIVCLRSETVLKQY